MARAATAKEPGPGDDLGVYHLETVAGEGGMGRVYRAVHKKLGRTVALKLLRRRYASRPDAVARFFQEARAVNVIRHPNIVEITDFVEHPDGDSYYIMEWLDGESLEARLSRKGVLTVDEAVAIGRQVASALGAAHAAGFIHRDLKPENVYLVERGGALTVKILDFGVALLQGTSDGAVAGTPVYMSPEVAAGRAVDARSDVYSLGVMLYQLLAGSPPFIADSLSGYVMKHMTAKPKPLAEAAPSPLPPSLAQTVDRCIEKAPEARFQSMDELSRALEAALDGPPKRKPRWPLVAGGALAVALIVGGIAFALHRSGTPSAPVARATPLPTLMTAPLPSLPSTKKQAPAQPEPADARVAVAITSIPMGAEVFKDGALLGTTPCVVRLPRGPSTVELRLDGWKNTPHAIEAAEGARVMVKLEPAKRKKTPPSRTGTINPFEQ